MIDLSARIKTILGMSTLTGMVAAGALAGSPVTLPYSTVTLVAGANAPSASPPAPQTFTITTAGAYTITLTDTELPAPLQSLELGVSSPTSAATVLSAPGGSATKTVTLQPGTYTGQVLATAAASSYGGSFAVTVTPQGSASTVAGWGGAVGPPSGAASSGASSWLGTFTANASGTDTVSLTDGQFPVALNAVNLLVIENDNGALVQTLLSPGTQTFAVAQGKVYSVALIAQADMTVKAGLALAAVTDGSGNAVLSEALPVGQLPAPQLLTVSQATTVTATLADLQYPAALGTLSGAVLQNNQLLSSASGVAATSVTKTFSVQPSATAGPLQLYTWGQSSAAGSYAWYVPGNSGVQTLDVAVPVLASGQYGYGIPGSLPQAATYQMTLFDFKEPAALAALSVAVEQQGAVLASKTGTSALVSFSGAAGPFNVLAFPTLASASAESLFSVVVANSTSGASALSATQGVGANFWSTTAALTTTGNYLLQVTDLGYQAPFTALTTILTAGQNTPIAQFTGTGTKIFNAPTTGNYVVNVLAQVAGGSDGNGVPVAYGSYGLNLAVAPAAPTATLSSSAASVVSGNPVTLTWAGSASAVSCAASAQPAVSGWSGALTGLSGTVTTGALTASTTFTLTCTDAYAQSGTASTQVTVSSASSSSSSGGGSGGGGGGGAFDIKTLLALGVLVICARRSGPATARSVFYLSNHKAHRETCTDHRRHRSGRRLPR